MRRRASFIGAAMAERIECIDDRSLLIANHPHLTAQGEILFDSHRLPSDLALQRRLGLLSLRRTWHRGHHPPHSGAAGKDIALPLRRSFFCNHIGAAKWLPLRPTQIPGKQRPFMEAMRNPGRDGPGFQTGAGMRSHAVRLLRSCHENVA